MKNEELYKKIEGAPVKSAWAKGVKEYALELIEGAEIELTRDNAKTVLLNGAENWRAYSWGGCSLIYDFDIAKRLCTPSELKKKKSGELKPNPREEWLDVQARALYQAFLMIKSNL